MSVSRARITVDGRVQGVYFRESTRREASRLALAGWVRNLDDGRVEAVFEGEPASVAQAVEWTRHGPDRAVVTSFEITAEEPQGLLGFEVRH
jgi:acylphosphatase